MLGVCLAGDVRVFGNTSRAGKYPPHNSKKPQGLHYNQMAQIVVRQKRVTLTSDMERPTDVEYVYAVRGNGGGVWLFHGTTPVHCTTTKVAKFMLCKQILETAETDIYYILDHTKWSNLASEDILRCYDCFAPPGIRTSHALMIVPGGHSPLLDEMTKLNVKDDARVFKVVPRTLGIFVESMDTRMVNICPKDELNWRQFAVGVNTNRGNPLVCLDAILPLNSQGRGGDAVEGVWFPTSGGRAMLSMTTNEKMSWLTQRFVEHGDKGAVFLLDNAKWDDVATKDIVAMFNCYGPECVYPSHMERVKVLVQLGDEKKQEDARLRYLLGSLTHFRVFMVLTDACLTTFSFVPKRMPVRVPHRRCGGCLRGSKQVALSTCSRCRKAWYCSATCQQAHRGQHKPVCYTYQPLLR